MSQETETPPAVPVRHAWKRRWTFRTLALALPFVLVASVELGLRLVGYGYSTDFFLKRQVGGREMLVDNPRFSWRFFPPSIARMQAPACFPAQKEPGTIRIFVFGESAAMGDPNPDFGCGRVLETLLRARHPTAKLETINVAMTAINSHVIREIAKECAKLEGDYWVVYMGNNEVVGPYGAGTVFGSQTANLATIRLSLWLKKLRLAQWLGSFRNRGPAEWKGMEMFLNQQVTRDDPRLSMVYQHFAANLADIVHCGEQAGAKVVLSTVAVNLKDCPPFASRLRPELDAAERATWQRHFDAGLKREAAGDFSAALAEFAQAAQVGGGSVERETHAELHFHLGRCYLALGRRAEAAAAFERAREQDTLRFRADDEINRLIAAQAEAEKGRLAFIPFTELAAHASADGIPGESIFYEHVHLTFDGNYLLARAVFETIEADLAHRSAVDSAPPGPILSAAECATALAWTNWDQLAVLQQVSAHLQQPPFSTQYGGAERDARWKERIAAVSDRIQPEHLTDVEQAYRLAIQRRPDDWVLHRNFAQLLEVAAPNAARLSAATSEWREVTRLLPHYPQAYFHLGKIAQAQGRGDDAVRYYRETLAHDPVGDPDLLEVRFCLGTTLLELNRSSEALPHLQAVAREFPNFAVARFNYGVVLERQGRLSEATREYRETLRLEPNFKPAQEKVAPLAPAKSSAAPRR